MSSIATAATPENRNRILIIAAVAFAAVAAVLVFVALQRGGEGGSTAAADVPVVVAAQEIPANTVITDEMVDIRSVPPDQVLGGVYSESQSVIGLPARYLIQSGQQITDRNIGAQEILDEKDLALVLEPGMRGFSVRVEEVTAVGGLLLPGNYVDVVAVNEGAAVMVTQNVQVLGVAQTAQEPVAPPSTAGDAPAGAETGSSGQGQRPEEIERQPSARSVTLALTPQQAVELALLQAEPDISIWLALRPAGDDAPVDLTGVSFIQVFPLPPVE